MLRGAGFGPPFLYPYPMKIIKTVPTYQAHPVPSHIENPRGPFPSELFREPEVVIEDIYEEPLGGTAQNNFGKLKWLRCIDCHARVREDQTEGHICG